MNKAERTFQANISFGEEIKYIFFFLLMFLGAGEFLARSDIYQEKLSFPDWGGSHYNLSHQLRKLQEVARQNGKVECIFLGNSMVMRGFDPLAFHNAYQNTTGENLWCFNFGVDGLPTMPAGILAEILVEDYQPQILLYGIDPRDLAVPVDAQDTKVILDMDWVRYRQGNLSIMGFLRQHSYFVRELNNLHRMLYFEFRIKSHQLSDQALADYYGFFGDPSVGVFVNESPDHNDPRSPIQYYFSILSDYQMLPKNMDGLEQILQLTQSSVKVLLIELPVPSTYMDFFGNGKRDYDRYLQRVQEKAQLYNVPIQGAPTNNVLHFEHWVDYSHLNVRGARVYSTWLGRELGKTNLSGESP
jgi:hypothetical protein